MRDESPLTREMAKTNIDIKDFLTPNHDKTVNFAISIQNNIASRQTLEQTEQEKASKRMKFAQSPPKGQVVPKNYKLLARQQYEKQ